MKKKCTYLQGIKRSDEIHPGEHLHLDISSGSDLLWSLLERYKERKGRAY